MAIKDTKFDAFISYRHAELDKFVAESIHKRLEAFRVPTSVRRKNKLAKDRIRRVFRDRDELPLASDLAEQITAALENSEFLIVICTPRLPESKWCRKEIETFIEMHGRKNVFAVLAEGEPSESFPDLLLYDEKEVVSETGVTEIVRVPVEPLAADVRGANKKEIRKKMDEELLRLVAPMFNLNYDDLKQRHREQKMKRIVGLSMVISSIFIVFGIFSGILSLKISQQADEIFEQNTLIQNKNDEISKQAELLQQQNDELQKSYAVSMALEAQELMADGRHYDALYAVRNAMPDSLTDTSLPYSAEAQDSLTDLLRVYHPASNYFPKNNFDVDAPVQAFRISDDWKKILILDENNTLTAWNVDGKKPFATFTSYNSSGKDTFLFANDNTILYSAPDKICTYNIETGLTMDIFHDFGSVYKIPSSEDYLVIGTTHASRITLSGDLVWEWELPPLGYIDTDSVQFSEDGTHAMIPTFHSCCIVELTTGTEVGTLDGIDLRDCVLLDSKIYTMETELFPSATTINCYDLASQRILWSKKHEDNFFYGLTSIKPSEKTSYLITYAYQSCYALSPSNGEIVHTGQTERSIATVSPTASQEAAVVTTRDNNHYLFLQETDELFGISFANTHLPSLDIETTQWILGGYFCSYTDTPMVSFFGTPSTPPDMVELTSIENYNYSINSNGSMRIERTDDFAYIYNTKNNELKNTIQLNGKRCDFAGDGTQYYILHSMESCEIYTLENDTLLFSLATDEHSSLGIGNNFVLEKRYSDNINRIHSLENPGTYYDIPEENYFFNASEFVLHESSSIGIITDREAGLITLVNLENGSVNNEIHAELGSILYTQISDDGKYIFTECTDGHIDIYEVTTGNLKKTLYNSKMHLHDIQYVPQENAYFVYGEFLATTIALNEDLEIIAHLPVLCRYMTNENRLLCLSDGFFYTLPFYPYDDLVKMGEEHLGDYVPAEKIKRKYNIR